MTVNVKIYKCAKNLDSTVLFIKTKNVNQQTVMSEAHCQVITMASYWPIIIKD